MRDAPAAVPLREALGVWLRIGLTSFGGPAGQIAMMHRELIAKRRWLDEARYVHALQFCMLLPGPEAQQLATYVGFLMHGTRGAVLAGGLFVLPGFLVITTLAALYAELGRIPILAGIFAGIGASVVAVVLEALVRIGKRALTSRPAYLIATLAFVALHLLGVPFPIVVLGTGAVGFALPGLATASSSDANAASATTSVVEAMDARGELAHTRPSLARAVRTGLVVAALWALPALALFLVFGAGSVFVREGVFFSQAAVVTFGGAYAVLGWVTERAVSIEHWLAPRQMLDGLGLAETTPGPLVLVLTFVGFLGAYAHPGSLPPLAAGLLGAFVTTWVTFLPSFLFILVLGPWIESIRTHPRLRGALAAITAAVLGVILHLSVWFAVHTLFDDVRSGHLGPLRWLAPTWASIVLWKLGVAAVSVGIVYRTKLGLGPVLAFAALAGLAARLLGWP